MEPTKEIEEKTSYTHKEIQMLFNIRRLSLWGQRNCEREYNGT